MQKLSSLYERAVEVKYSNHAKKRLTERVDGELIVVPHFVKFTKTNIYSHRTKEGHISSVVIGIPYKRNIKMYMAIAPNSWLVKTVWFEKKSIKKRFGIKKAEQETLYTGNITEERGSGENVGDVYGNMVGETTLF